MIRTEAHARARDPRTSFEAAASVQETQLEARVLSALARFPAGATSYQLARALDMSLVTVSPRLRPLVNKGLVRDSGRKARGESGRAQIVWETAPRQRVLQL